MSKVIISSICALVIASGGLLFWYYQTTPGAVTKASSNAPTAARSNTGVSVTVSSAVDVSAWNESQAITESEMNASGAVGRTLAIDSAGVLHMTWTENQGQAMKLFYAASTDDGQTWSEKYDVAQTTVPSFGGTIAVGSQQDIHIVWPDRRLGIARVFYTRSTDGGRTWMAPHDINGTLSEKVATASITVDGAGHVHVAWHTGNPDDSTAQPAAVYYTGSRDGGETFAVPQRLNTAQAHAAWPRFIIANDGSVVAVAWRDNRRNPDWDIYVAISKNGGTSFSEQSAVASATREWDPELLIDARNVFHLTFMRMGDAGPEVAYTRSEDAGQSWSEPVTLSQARGRFSSFAYNTAKHHIWLMWKDDIESSTERRTMLEGGFIVATYSTDGGKTWSTIEKISTTEQARFPSFAAAPDGSSYVVWDTDVAGNGNQTIFLTKRTQPVQ